MPHMYILKCADASYYVGSTRDLETRFFLHNDGRGAEYTRHRLPVELAFAHETDTIEEAFALEKQVQGWSRAKREALIRGDWSVLPALSKKNFHRDDPGS